MINIAALRHYREQKHWSQRDLARVAKVDASIVSRLERGLQDDMTVGVLVALSDALDIPPAALLPPIVEDDSPRSATLTAEMADVVRLVAFLPPRFQNHLAATIRGYVAGIKDLYPEEDSGGSS